MVGIDPGLEQALLTPDDPRQPQGRRGAPAIYPWHCCPVGGWWRLEDDAHRNSCRTSYQNRRVDSGELYEFHRDGDHPGGHICLRVR